jgi:hypothetical protein
MSSPLRAHGLAPTLIAVPVGLTATAVFPPQFCAGAWIKYQSGGTLAMVNAASGVTAVNGYIFGTTEPPLNIDGPATFFLNAAGSTSVAAVIFKQSAGFSLFP